MPYVVTQKKLFFNLSIFIAVVIAVIFSFVLYRHYSYAVSDTWYGSNWQYRTKITISRTEVPVNLTDFPVYVNLANLPTDFFQHVKQGGGDIRVTRADGVTEVPREVVSLDTANSTGELDFKATLSAYVNNSFYIYYGNSAANDYASTDTYGRNAVWSNYEAVLHMNSTTIVDSTGHGHVPIKQVGVTATTADGRPALYFNGSAYLDFGNQINMGLGNLSISAYVATKGTYVSFIAKSYYSGADGRYSLLYSNADGGLVSLYDAGPDNRNTSYTGTFNDGNLRQIAVTYDRSSNNSLYMNGVLRSTNPISDYRNYNSNGANHLFIGTYNDPSNGTGIQPMLNFTGKMREVRFSRNVLSSYWLATEYNNQNNPANFYSVGATSNVHPTVSTGGASSVTNTTAEIAGSVASDGGPTITSQGIVYGTNVDPTTADTMATASDATFNVNLTGLTPATMYHYRTFAVSSVGMSYGVDETFTTLPNAPIAIFSADKTIGSAPLTTSFTDDSTNSPTSWDWNFGDGSDSTAENPTHIYSVDGTYTVSLTVRNAGGSDSRTRTALVVVDSVAPIVSHVAADVSLGASQTSIIWDTDEVSSSQVSFGTTSALGQLTNIIDANNGVINHKVNISNLVPCSIYYYKVTSSDLSGNTTTSSTSSFITSACPGASKVTDYTGQKIDTNVGGTLKLSNMSLGVLAGFSDSNAVFQLKQLDQAVAIGSIGGPAGLNQIGTNVFDITALSDESSTIDNFFKPISVTIGYNSADVAKVDLSSLAIYRWDSGAGWTKLDDCTTNTRAQTVTCTTSGFSVFALFGSDSIADHTGSTDPGHTNSAKSSNTTAGSQSVAEAAPSQPSSPTPRGEVDGVQSNGASGLQSGTEDKNDSASNRSSSFFADYAWWLVAPVTVAGIWWWLVERRRSN